MFGLNLHSPAVRVALAAAVLIAIVALVPPAHAATRGGIIAQPPPLAHNGAACTTGHFYDLVMPDEVDVLSSCPGTNARVFADLDQLYFGTQVFNNWAATPPTRRAATANGGDCVGGYRWVWMSDNDEEVPIRCS